MQTFRVVDDLGSIQKTPKMELCPLQKIEVTDGPTSLHIGKWLESGRLEQHGKYTGVRGEWGQGLVVSSDCSSSLH